MNVPCLTEHLDDCSVFAYFGKEMGFVFIGGILLHHFGLGNTAFPKNIKRAGRRASS